MNDDRMAYVGLALIGLAVLLVVAAVALFIAAIWATGEAGNDLFLTGCVLGACAPFVAIAGVALVGAA